MTTPREQVLVDALRAIVEADDAALAEMATMGIEASEETRRLTERARAALAAYESPRPGGEDTELVKRLHKYSRSWSERAGSNAICLEAATRIEQLSDEVARLRRAKEIVDLYYAPWGAAKAARWEDLTGDKPFAAEVALQCIREALR